MELRDLNEQIDTESNVLKDRTSTGLLIKGVYKTCTSYLDGVASKFTKLFIDLAKTVTDEVISNTYKVEVKNQPKVQEVSGKIDLNDNKQLKQLSQEIANYQKSLNETKKYYAEIISILKAQKEPDFTKLQKAVEAIKIPEVNIPKPIDKLEITNLKKVESLLKDLVAKPEFKPSMINIPPQPKEITVGNLDEITKAMEEEEPTGYNFQKDASGNLESFTEIYPSGKVTSSGWNIGLVTIKDTRK